MSDMLVIGAGKSNHYEVLHESGALEALGKNEVIATLEEIAEQQQIEAEAAEFEAYCQAVDAEVTDTFERRHGRAPSSEELAAAIWQRVSEELAYLDHELQQAEQLNGLNKPKEDLFRPLGSIATHAA